MNSDNNVIGKENFLKASKEYLPDQIILRLGSAKAQKNNPDRIQVDATHYILPPHLIYHSCDPNAYIDWEHMALKALCKIPKGETITYHYGTSEFDYEVGAFQCDCGSEECVGFFSGFRSMSPDQQGRIVDHISPYIQEIRELLDEKKPSTRKDTKL